MEEEQFLRVSNEEINSKGRSEHTKALSLKFIEKGWSLEGTEIPFEFRFTEEGQIQEYANLQTPWQKWMESSPSKKEKIQALQPVVNALKNLHANNIVHRDIKPANIVVDANLQGKLIDWDSWYDCENSEEPEFTGTSGFLSEELLENNEGLKAVDVFALGITFYVIFQPKTLKHVRAGMFGSEIIQESEQLEPLDRLILDMTSQDPLKRPAMAQVANRFQQL